jgi:hypothetical protein
MLVTWNAALVRVWAFGEFRVEYRVKDGSWKQVYRKEISWISYAARF